jgi:hypothetical protein
MGGGKLGGKIKNAGTQVGSGPNTPQSIKNSVGMCNVGGQGFAKIKGAVS